MKKNKNEIYTLVDEEYYFNNTEINFEDLSRME